MILPRIINQGPFRVQRSAGALWGTPWLLSEKRTLKEKHRTEVTEATEEGIGLVKKSWGGTPCLPCENELRGEHRTEATEATEEENWGWRILVDTLASERERRSAEKS
jgi:hypothetical protein